MKSKKTAGLLAALGIMLCPLLPHEKAQAADIAGDIFISEVCFDPAFESGTKKQLRDNDYFEFVEIMNIGPLSFAFADAELCYTNGERTLKAPLMPGSGNDGVMEPGEIWVIGIFSAKTAELGLGTESEERQNEYWKCFCGYYGCELTRSERMLAAAEDPGFFLPNGDENGTLEIKTASGTAARFSFSPKAFSANGYAVQGVLSGGMAYAFGGCGCSPGRVDDFQLPGAMPELFPHGGEEVGILVLNVCYKAEMENIAGLETEKRIGRLHELIGSEGAGIICLNEVSEPWMQAFEGEKEYGMIGESCYGGIAGRGMDEKDTYNPVLYRKDCFSLVEGGSVWLRGRGAFVGNKVCTHALLRSRQSGKYILVVNTHLSSDGENGDFANRALEVKNLCEKLRVITAKARRTAKTAGLPVLLCGDMNIHEGSPLYRTLVENTGLDDIKYTARHMLPFPTFNDWGRRGGFKGTVIDFCFAGGELGADHYEVLAENMADGMPISDHNALKIGITI